MNKKPEKKKRNKTGRRRRGKKDTILDFSKKFKPKRIDTDVAIDEVGEGKPKEEKSTGIGKRQKKSTYQPPQQHQQADVAKYVPKAVKKTKSKKGKISLTTGHKDYGCNLGLPEKVSQRDYESTGQFFRRLDRLAAKAKVEASLEARFDMTLRKE